MSLSGTWLAQRILQHLKVASTELSKRIAQWSITMEQSKTPGHTDTSQNKTPTREEIDKQIAHYKEQGYAGKKHETPKRPDEKR